MNQIAYKVVFAWYDGEMSSVSRVHSYGLIYKIGEVVTPRYESYLYVFDSLANANDFIGNLNLPRTTKLGNYKIFECEADIVDVPVFITDTTSEKIKKFWEYLGEGEKKDISLKNLEAGRFDCLKEKHGYLWCYAPPKGSKFAKSIKLVREVG